MPRQEIDYKDLMDLLPDHIWDKFSFSEYYTGEATILKPAMERMGFTDVVFSMGERDSFGPLSRICSAKLNGKSFWFFYG